MTEFTGLLFYLVSVLIAGGIYALLCLALNIQWGMGGLFNAGIVGFFAIGAYTSAIPDHPGNGEAPGRFRYAGLRRPFRRRDHCRDNRLGRSQGYACA